MSDFDTIDAQAIDTTVDTAVEDVAAPEIGPSVDDAINAAVAAQEAPQEDAGQPRDPMGRFAAKAAAEAAEAAAKATDPNAAPAAPVAGQMPAAWGRDKADLWAKTPPEVQSYIAERERQVSEGFKQYEGLAEYAESARGNGLTLRDVMGRVRELETVFNSDPPAGVVEMCRRSGFDPVRVAQAILGNAGQQPEGQAQAPQIDPVQRELQTLRSVVDELRIQPIKQQVDAFASDPANKYFDRVTPGIKALIAADPNLSLKDAYERAIWADPQVRAEMMQEKQAKAQQVTQLAKSTQTAQRASRGLTPSGSRPFNGAVKAMSIDEAIQAAVAAQS